MDYLCKEDIVQSFRNCGVKTGSILMLHSDAIFLAQTHSKKKDDKYALLFAALDKVLGNEGTLIIPTFTYSATKNEPFIVEETPSTVGAISEYFRKMPNVLRTSDPNFSVAVKGLKARDFVHTNVNNAFGPNSVFGLIDHHDAWIVCMACSFDNITFTHFIEQSIGVKYRYIKKFNYEIINNNTTKIGEQKYYVRDLNINSKINLLLLKEKLIQENKLQIQFLKRFTMMAVKCSDFKESAKIIINENPLGLINEAHK